MLVDFFKAHGPVVVSATIESRNRPSRVVDPPRRGAPKSRDTIEQYVERHGGTFVIQRVLIANNGLAAVKEMRSIRKWAYSAFNDERAISFIVMATPEDVAANAEFVLMADEVIQVPGGPNTHNYANVRVIVDVARRCRAHAVWAGWGHASENPKLPEALEPLGIAFVGPTAGAMHALGDKISSMIVAQTASVPCLPWSGSGLTVTPDDQGKIRSVDQDVYRAACVRSVEEGLAAAEKIGFPLMIKASEGGGGKGIRRVNGSEEFATNFDFVQREVPGSPVFLMKLASTARHLEVQILADKYGQAVALSGRDCSVQRRHQKIIEEAPVTVFSRSEEWRELEEAAVRLAKLVGYESTGTVEYLLDIEHQQVSFLELNPRLQVEHPCTEMITGVNLPAAQLQVAMGIPLHRIPDVRILYGRTSESDSSIDFDGEQAARPPHGHVIACRLTAENPEAGFKPGGGRLTELTFRSAPNVWGYFSIKSAGLVHEYADSQFGHVFAWGHGRTEAREAMVLALKEMTLRSEFRTTAEYIVKLLETDTFRSCKQTTAWLDELIKGGFGRPKLDWIQMAAAGAVWMAMEHLDRVQRDATALLAKGQIPPADFFERKIHVKFIMNQTQYCLQVHESSPRSLVLLMRETELSVLVSRQADGAIMASMLDGQNFIIYGRPEAAGLLLTVNGCSCLLEKEHNPTIVRTPSPGKLVRYLVEDGQMVAAGTAIAEIEVMKMYMTLSVSNAGKVKPSRSSGSTLEAGDIIANILLLDPAGVKMAKENESGFTTEPPPAGVHLDVAALHEQLEEVLWNAILGGYRLGECDKHRIVDTYLQTIMKAELPLVRLEHRLSNVSGRMRRETRESLESCIRQGYDGAATDIPDILRTVMDILEESLLVGDPRDAANIKGIIEEIVRHLEGPTRFAEERIARLGELAYSDAILFDEALTLEGAYQKLRGQYEDNWDLIYRAFVAFTSGEERQIIFAALLKTTLAHLPKGISPKSPLMRSLRKLAKLSDAAFKRLGHAAREVLVSSQLPSLTELRTKMEDKLKSHDRENHEAFIKEMVSGFAYHIDVLPNFFLHPSVKVRMLALEIYINRVLEAFDFVAASVVDGDIFTWMVAAPQVSAKDHASITDASAWEHYERRSGAFAAFNGDDEARQFFARVVQRLSPEEATKNVVYFAIPDNGASEEEVLLTWVPFMQRQEELLRTHNIKRVTMIKVRENSFSVGFYTFREMLGWREDCQVRHMEPAMSYLLELPRMLENYKIKLLHADPTGQIHIYRGDALCASGQSRLFIRVVVRPVQTMRGHNTLLSLAEDAKSIFSDVLDAVAMVLVKNPVQFNCNHLYINVLPRFYAQPESAVALFLALTTSYADKLKSLKVMEGEIQMQMSTRKGEPAEKFRFYLFDQTGCDPRVDVYREVRPAEDKKAILTLLDPEGRARAETCFDGLEVSVPHGVLSNVQIKRNKVQALGTAYVYDFPLLFEKALDLQWTRFPQKRPARCCEFVELVLSDDANGGLVECVREEGQNDIGMVAWRATIRTPDCPQGRSIIVIANDMEHRIGSFGVEEDRLFAAASALARRHHWPRIYLSANSGARIGVAEDLRGLIRAKWRDPNDPMQGFSYLYVKGADYPRVQRLVRAEPVKGEDHFKITDILGGLGVENLSGSALIASETSRSYLENFTLTFVTGRSVGIGAYLVRLGQRVIQKVTQPIILTGVQALNQLLGREVYSSNLQIGGPQIMAHNGVSHRTVYTDLEGVQEILNWLGFVPNLDAGVPPTRVPNIHGDCPTRDVEYCPPRSEGGKVESYDARRLVTGVNGKSGFIGGLLDRGSFIEYLSDWAKSVIVGRGRLGGMPVAVILVETRTTEKHIPADPASLKSESTVQSQAGQVWYPDSAFKTAQFLRDCNHGERLPLLILANWRGFSGGQRDLFEEILKFGSYIVDALREYQQPVFVYLPPGAQLRGGSWVVVDGAINPAQIEMYADPSARGGILEPEGLVSIKFRGKQLSELATRIMPEYAQLAPEQKDQLLTAAHQVACSFVDLHDRPGRMLELGVIRGIVEWKDARRFFYHRLRVRLLLQRLMTYAVSRGCRVTDVAIDTTDINANTGAETSSPMDFKAKLLDEWLPRIIGATPQRDDELADAMEEHYGLLQQEIEIEAHAERVKTLEAQLLRLTVEERDDLMKRVMDTGETRHPSLH